MTTAQMSAADIAALPDVRIGFLESLKRPTIRTLTLSRGASRLASTTVSYGAMVALAATGSEQWQISLVSASTYLSAVLFGLQGGLLSDTLSKRRGSSAATSSWPPCVSLFPSSLAPVFTT